MKSESGGNERTNKATELICTLDFKINNDELDVYKYSIFPSCISNDTA